MLKYALLTGMMTIALPAVAQVQPGTVPIQSEPAVAPQDAAAQPVAGADQVASVVETEFPTYDANKDGKLEKAEFASWMVKLKQASDPSASEMSPATRSWVDAAFAQADKDGSRTVTQPELIGFLNQGRS